MKEIFQFVARVAPSDSTVLIEGESGTGKELAARALHRNSHRASKPFMAINCAAIPETLLESDLFGHERGAFTGAAVMKKGRLEVADGGVVFLDEIGELAPTLQVKLLRVLQEREFERVGGTHPIKIDVRLIAATNKDLEEAVTKGEFRRDLYYRLNVVKLTMPALRERKEDIPMLTRHFVQKHAKRCKVKTKPVSREAMAALVNYEWPGNVRELENAIERALVMGDSGHGAARRFAGITAGTIASRRDSGREISRGRKGIEEAIDSGCGGTDAGKLRGGGRDSGSASKLPSPADSEFGNEGRVESGTAWAGKYLGRSGVIDL